MTAPTEITIQLDAKHKAHRSQNRWAVQQKQANGAYDTIATWSGGRRSLYQWCEQNDVHPTRGAEQKIDALPEASGFRERG